MNKSRGLAALLCAGGCAIALSACARGIGVPNNRYSYLGLPVEVVEAEFSAMGFDSVQGQSQLNEMSAEDEGLVTAISIDGSGFSAGDRFRSSAPVVITYYGTYEKPSETAEKSESKGRESKGSEAKAESEPKAESESKPTPEPEPEAESEPEPEPKEDADSTPQNVTISPDRYTQYVRDYRGKNAASFGYSSLGGDRRDSYGAANIQLVFVTEDGKYFDYTDENALKDYVVYAQNVAPNTEFKMAFQTDENGEEYSSLTSWVGLDEIVLNIKKVGAADGTPRANVPITPGDKYNRYVGDYVGRNLASFGYTSLFGDRRVYVGGGNMLLNITAEDGSWVDPSDGEALKNYVVIGQSIEANSPVSVSFDTDSSGKEYDSLGHASIDAIDLTVRRVG